MLFPPNGAEQLLGRGLLCSSFHQRKCQRSKLCCQMPHGHQMFPTGSHQPALPRQRGEGSSSRFHPSCPELPQLLQAHLSHKPLATLGSLQASDEGDRCWGMQGGPLATPEQKPFSSPRSPLALFLSLLDNSFVWVCQFVASPELNPWQKGTALQFYFIKRKATPASPSSLYPQDEKGRQGDKNLGRLQGALWLMTPFTHATSLHLLLPRGAIDIEM